MVIQTVSEKNEKGDVLIRNLTESEFAEAKKILRNMPLAMIS